MVVRATVGTFVWPAAFNTSLSVSLCFLKAVVEEDCMPMEQFGQHLLPSLLSLSSDPVANVRVLVAKALRQSVMEKGNGQIRVANFMHFP